MKDVIDNDLTFYNDAEKQAWHDEASHWRLPYWDWALPSYGGSMPELFKPMEVKVCVPTAKDGSQPPPETVTNPLYRYQLRVDGKLTKMGDLPMPFTVDDVEVLDGKTIDYIYPVSVPRQFLTKCTGF